MVQLCHVAAELVLVAEVAAAVHAPVRQFVGVRHQVHLERRLGVPLAAYRARVLEWRRTG